MNYFEYVLRKYEIPKDIKLIVVTHILPNTEEFLLTLNKEGYLACVIAKPTSINKDSYEKITKEMAVFNNFKQSLKTDSMSTIKELHDFVGTSKCIILDIGGYFSTTVSELKTLFGKKFWG